MEETISLYRQALTLFPVGHPNRSASLLYLANVVRDRFAHGGDPADLNEAFSLYHEAAGVEETESPE